MTSCDVVTYSQLDLFHGQRCVVVEVIHIGVISTHEPVYTIHLIVTISIPIPVPSLYSSPQTSTLVPNLLNPFNTNHYVHRLKDGIGVQRIKEGGGGRIKEGSGGRGLGRWRKGSGEVEEGVWGGGGRGLGRWRGVSKGEISYIGWPRGKKWRQSLSGLAF